VAEAAAAQISAFQDDLDERWAAANEASKAHATALEAPATHAADLEADLEAGRTHAADLEAEKQALKAEMHALILPYKKGSAEKEAPKLDLAAAKNHKHKSDKRINDLDLQTKCPLVSRQVRAEKKRCIQTIKKSSEYKDAVDVLKGKRPKNGHWTVEEAAPSFENAAYVANVEEKGRCMFSRRALGGGVLLCRERAMFRATKELNPTLYDEMAKLNDSLNNSFLFHFAALMSFHIDDLDTLHAPPDTMKYFKVEEDVRTLMKYLGHHLADAVPAAHFGCPWVAQKWARRSKEKNNIYIVRRGLLARLHS
jgi:hypothetical protein